MGGYILIVDDDESLLDALDMELSDRGYPIRRATNGQEALERIREELPMLIITDLAMPVMNGRKMLQLIRRDPRAREVPVIILSAFGYEWESELMGAQGHIRKPVTTAQLEEVIARVLLGVSPRSAVLLN